MSVPDADAGWVISRSRLESFSDAIMAVAITLLVLKIDPPDVVPGESLAQALDAETARQLFVFALSFFFIAMYWYLHHRTFNALPARLPMRIVVVNFAFLAVICLWPFTNELYAAHNDDLVAFVVYAVSVALGSVLISLMGFLGGRPLTMVAIGGPLIFIGSTIVALYSPELAPMTWFLIALIPKRPLRGAPAS